MTRFRSTEKGAALVELAVVLPIFILLIFGTMEAGWLFASVNNMNHGSREGARLAAVNFDDGDVLTTDDVLVGMCGRMGLASSSNPVVTLSASDTNADGFIGRGDLATVKVEMTYASLTGVLDATFDGKKITTETEFRLEQPLDGSVTIEWPTASTGVACP